MYGYEYEFDFLLCLRLLKFLHMQSPEAAKRVVEIYKELDTEEIGIVMEEILWDIFSDAEFDTDEFNELTIVYFSHRDIDRLMNLDVRNQPDTAGFQIPGAERSRTFPSFLQLGRLIPYSGFRTISQQEVWCLKRSCHRIAMSPSCSAIR